MKKMFLALTLASLGWAGSAQADTVLLQDNFSDVPNAGQATFNNNLATTQTGSSLGSITYSLATENGPGGEASANAWQHGNATKTSGDMLLHGRDNQASAGNPVVFAGLNHNFATDANSANLPLVIEFNIWVEDPDTGGTWEAVNIGNATNKWVNAAETKFGSLFVPNGATQQFPQSPNNNGITYSQGDQIRLVLSDASGTASAFNSSGTSVVKMYQNGTLVHTFTGLALAATDGYVSFQSYFAAGYVANLSIRLAAAPPSPLTVAISPLNPAVTNGSTVAFTGTATGGVGNYTYQWLQNGTNLTGQTGTTLTLNNVTLGMNGYTYDVVVHSGSTNVTSAVSTLTVQAPVQSFTAGQLIDIQLLGQTGETVAGNQQVQTGAAVLGAGSDTWNHLYNANGGSLWPSVSLVDATGAAIGVTETFSASHYDTSGNANSPALPLLSVCAFGGPELTLTGLPPSTQCQLVVYAGFGLYPLGGNNVTVNGSSIGNLAANPVNTLSACYLEAIVFSDYTGTLVIGAANAMSGVQLQLAPGPLAVSISPTNPAYIPGNTATFTAKATGGTGNYTYQWSKNGVGSLTGQTNRTLVITGLTTNDNGKAYYVVANDGSTSATSGTSTLTVTPLTVTPSLAQVLNAPYAPGLKVDANPAHWPSNSTAFYWDTSPVNPGGFVGPAGNLGVTIQYAWDNTNLYILVKEDTHLVTAGSEVEATTTNSYLGNGFNYDSVALWMDFQNDCGDTNNGVPVSNTDAEHTLFNPWFGLSSTDLPGLLYNQSSGATLNSYAGLTNAQSATSGTFAAHNRVIELALAWKDIAGFLPVNLQPGGNLLAAVMPGLKIGSEPLLVYNNYIAQSFANGTQYTVPSGVDASSLDVLLTAPPVSPVLTARLEAGQVIVRWPAATPSTYHLFTSPVLGSGASWTQVVSPAPVLDPANTSLWKVPFTPVGKAFFRLQQ